jgi:hypothetical protein
MIRAGMWNDGLHYTDSPKPSALFPSQEKAEAGLESWKRSAYVDVKHLQTELKNNPKRARTVKKYLAKAQSKAEGVEKELSSLKLAVLETKITIIK